MYLRANVKAEECIQSTKASLNEVIILNIIYIQNILSDRFNDTFKPYGLSFEQFNVLEILENQKGKPVNMFVIQEKMITKTSNTTRLVDKLLLKKLVTREICNENRRKIEVFITKEGFELVRKIRTQLNIQEENFGGHLNLNELEVLDSLLNKYKQNLISNNTIKQ